MTAFMDFGVLPPEINSGRIYSGPGSAPLLAAATAWSGLAADLRSTADDYSSTVAGLTSDGWQGPASASMATAASSYAGWLNTTAAQAEQTAGQATAAAGAYETTLAASVPPPAIAANRAQLASLVATNIIGQNTPAIAATEAEYGQMWAQDAAAMYGYAGSAAAATKVTPFGAPRSTTNPGALSTQAAAVAQATGTSAGSNTQTALSQLTSAIPSTLQNLAAPGAALGSTSSGTTSTSGVSSLFSQLFNSNGLGLNSNIWNTITSTGAFNPIQVIQAITGSSFLGAGLEHGLGGLTPSALGGGLGSGALGAAGVPASPGLGGLGGAVSGGLGRAATLGPLSVPPSWTPAAPSVSPLGSALGGTPIGAPPSVGPAMPGVAPAGMTGRAASHVSLPDTRFLDRPPMVPTWSVAG
jgi:PPE-repeat protein